MTDRHRASARPIIRAYRPSDRDAVLALINADRLPGQPMATAAHLAEAVAGRSPVDSGWWSELTDLRIDVLAADEEVLGAVSYAQRPRDDAGVLLWLHAGEQPEHLARLVEHVLDQLRRRAAVGAFEFATALGVGLEALPARHRAATVAALETAGFTGSDLWRYMRRDLTNPAELPDASPPAGVRIEVSVSCDPPGWTLTATGGAGSDDTVGEIVVGIPHTGIGVVWWLETNPAWRGHGIGRALLAAGLCHLHAQGACEVILYVDDDEPGSARDRRAANHLYDRMGFVEIDRLISYRRTTTEITGDLAVAGQVRA